MKDLEPARWASKSAALYLFGHIEVRLRHRRGGPLETGTLVEPVTLGGTLRPPRVRGAWRGALRRHATIESCEKGHFYCR